MGALKSQVSRRNNHEMAAFLNRWFLKDVKSGIDL